VKPTVLALALMAATVPVQAQQDGPRIGHEALHFELDRLDSGHVELEGLRGRPVIINFWASWCAPCRAEMPDLISAWRQHSGHGLQVLAVNLTDQERRKDVTRFVAELEMPFPVLLDTRGKVRELYALISLPTTVFVDSTGIVRGVHSGPLTRNALALGLGAILPAPPAISPVGTPP
jgi:peroxiredoxin